MDGIAERTLNDKEAIALNLIYLAKGFQHKYNDNTDDFLLNCAELAYKYDSLSLNALLLKAEVTENKLLKECQANNLNTIAVIRANKNTKELLINYETQLNNLYTLGYREIPKEIENMILAKIQHGTEGSFITNKTPNPFKEIGANQRYATLSWGMFEELHENIDTAEYFHVLFNTETKKIIGFLPTDSSNNYKVDPVVFAMNIDPMFMKYPSLTPYCFVGNSPIIFNDPDGSVIKPCDQVSKEQLQVSFNAVFGSTPQVLDRIKYQEIGIDQNGNKVSAFVFNEKDGNGKTVLTMAAAKKQITANTGLSKKEKLVALSYLKAVGQLDIVEVEHPHKDAEAIPPGSLTKNEYENDSKAIFNNAVYNNTVTDDINQAATGAKNGETGFKYFDNEKRKTETVKNEFNKDLNVNGLYNINSGDNSSQGDKISNITKVILDYTGGDHYSEKTSDNKTVTNSIDSEGNVSTSKPH